MARAAETERLRVEVPVAGRAARTSTRASRARPPADAAGRVRPLRPRRRARRRRDVRRRRRGRARRSGRRSPPICAPPACAATARASCPSTRRSRTSSSRSPSGRCSPRTSISPSPRRRSRDRPRHGLPTPLRRGRGPHSPRPPDRRRRRPARARGDVQGARGRPAARLPSARKEEPMAEKEAVRTEEAPAPFQGAPYSQAIRAGGLVFVSGQVALGPGAAEPVVRRDRRADRAGVREPARDPRGGGQRPRPGREDDRLPDRTSTTSRR